MMSLAWDPPRPRRRRIPWLPTIAAIVVAAVAIPANYHATQNGGGGSGKGGGNGLPPNARVYPGNLTISNRATNSGYYGPSPTGFCGNNGACPPPAGGYFPENASQSFSWGVSIHNPSNGTHDVDYFLVNSPFTLQSYCYYTYCDAVPVDPAQTVQFVLTIQAPAAVGNYTLNVTLVTEF